MKSQTFRPLVVAACLAITSFVAQGCDKPKTSSPPPKASAAASSSAQPAVPKVHSFHKFGVSFKYPEPYKVKAVNSNPEVYQIAIDHSSAPGVLTIRFNPQHPSDPVDIDQVAEVTRMNYGKKATVSPSKLVVGAKSYEARLVKSKPLNLVTSDDVMAVVPIGGINYVVLTHTAEEDAAKTKIFFDTVLKSLRADPSTRPPVPAASASASASSSAPKSTPKQK